MKPVHSQSVDEALLQLGVDLGRGLDSSEASARLESHGENRLADVDRRPAWKRFADQFKDFLIAILFVAAVVSLFVSGDVKTPIVVLVVVMLNAVIGFVQENRAESSLEALKKMLTANTRVRRNGDVLSVESFTIVPGDIVLVEAGDRVPADGRIVLAANLEIEEAALTGESQPAMKSIAPVERVDAPLGDRTSVAYMNTTVTRGRAEILVTSTGMDTEIGRIAGLLRATETDKTPLQKQLEGLAHSLAKLSGVVVLAVVVVGLLRGEEFTD